MKIFFLSSPFNSENSGDYDYCSATTESINALQLEDIKAEYVRLHTDDIETVGQDAKNKGINFREELKEFHTKEGIAALQKEIVDYVTSPAVADTKLNIINLQLRAPQSGFLLEQKHLLELQGVYGFKIVITCHEYELNYSRKWLQAACHAYFEVADRVFFFSKQDYESASAHAGKEVFLDTIFAAHKKLPEPYEMMWAFSSKAHRSLVKRKDSEGAADDDEAYFLTDYALQSLECEKLIGSIEFAKGAPVRCSFSGQVVSLKDSANLELEYGIRTNVQVPKQTKPFKVTGIIVNPKTSDKLKSVKNQTEGEFNFDYKPYDLESKSSLTRVVPTVADIDGFDPENAIKKPANLIIFGLIRDGKGFEDALSIIRKIHFEKKAELPETRLIVVGKVFSYDLLADLMNAKFGLKNIVSDVDLKNIDQFETQDEAKPEIDRLIKEIRRSKLKDIKSALQKAGSYTDDIEYYVLNQKMSQYLSSATLKVQVTNPCNLQILVEELIFLIPEALPIDFALNVGKQDLPGIFAQAKYAIKFDEKGWANNASGLINMLAFGCILYTGFGMCTDEEEIKAKYPGAIVMPKRRYGLKEGEYFSPKEEEKSKRQHFKSQSTKKLSIESKVQFVCEDDVIKDIIARECGKAPSKGGVLDSTFDNMSTFAVASKLLGEEFHHKKIATEIVGQFQSWFMDVESV